MHGILSKPSANIVISKPRLLPEKETMAAIIFNAYSLMKNQEKGGLSDEATSCNTALIGVL